MKKAIILSIALWATAIAVGAQNRDITYGNSTLTMVKVEGGTFLMGAQNTNPDAPNYCSEAGENEAPTHNVTLSDYYISQTVVSQQFWYDITGGICQGLAASNPTRWEEFLSGGWFHPAFPAFHISFNELEEFVSELNNVMHSEQIIGDDEDFFIPTEAEWEYAARGGKKSKGYLYAGSNNANEVAWTRANHAEDIQTEGVDLHLMANKKANELGIYDMSGTMEEWCADIYNDYPDEVQTNPLCTTSKYGAGNIQYVLRGGNFARPIEQVRITSRSSNPPHVRMSYYGARLVLKKKPSQHTTLHDSGSRCGTAMGINRIDMQGRKNEGNAKGLFVERTHYADGTTKSALKIIR